MKILLLGRDGQLGWELARALAPWGELVAWGRAEADLSRPEALAKAVAALSPQVIVNAAAHTAVDKAESEPALARAVNALAPAALAQVASQCGAWLLHYSTDYVFNGEGQTPWREDDAIAPLNTYGLTKAEGEALIRATGVRHLILRTSWVYAARGGNFARTMLRLAAQREQLSVVDDQHGAPTGAELLADAGVHALRLAMGNPSLGGTYHLAAAGCTTWHGYARHVIATAAGLGWALRCAPAQVQPTTSAAYPTPARRPSNSRLDCSGFERSFGLALPPWQQGVERVIAEWWDARTPPGATA